MGRDPNGPGIVETEAPLTGASNLLGKFVTYLPS